MDLTHEIIVLCIVAFMAGFVDAIAGGGGLLQTPAGLILLPQYPVATIIGTLKIPAFSGTSFAAIQYAGNVRINYKLLGVMMAIAFAAAFAGSTLLNAVSSTFMKPFLLVVLILVAVYTFSNKNFGIHIDRNHSSKQFWQYSIIISLVIGFYDGFIGPGAGSFLILALIGLMGFDFLKASANAKFVNMATNLGSITFFAIKGKIIYSVALPMAICNAFGGIIGARLAILRGNNFIRIFLLVIVCITILRFAYDVFFR
ncbi:MAG TPA: TSUP family transporter [Flavitalea sp.]|nr:TSUP family transporter [Flavitalea sp.]